LDNLGSDRQYLFKNLGSGLWEVFQFLDGGDCIKSEVVDKERQLKLLKKGEFMFFLSDQNRAN
jgi:hypothetical protein